MIKWNKRNKRKLNINDIKKVIDILPCSWADGYEENGEPAPHADGNNLIYAVSDDSDGYIVMYYKCSADGTILQTGYEDYGDW
jgi:hypothetical protein